ncbi:MAG: PIN domain-containing protein [Sedimenticola sp.]
MGIVVDTNVFIDAENDRLDLASLLAGDDHYFLAAITVSELLTGVALAKNPADRIHRLTWSESIIETMPILSFDLDVARTYAEVYAHQLQHSRRQSLSVHDLQIAATAIVHDYAVLTSNAGDFKQVPGLRLLTP